MLGAPFLRPVETWVPRVVCAVATGLGVLIRFPPRPLIGLCVFVGYAVLVAILWLALGVDYETVGDSTSNVVRGIVIPIGVGALLLAVVTTYLGWWRLALLETPSGPRWLRLLPVVLLVAVIAGIAAGDYGSRETSFFVWLAIGTLLVGFSEELLTRGLLVVGFRGGMGEVGVWFSSSLAFGLLHGLNALFGQPIAPTIRQVVFAFVFGSVFYVVRRVSGTLIVCMVLHALWDFATFAQTADDHAGTTDPAQDVNLMQPIAFVAVVIAAIGLWKLLRDRAPEPRPETV